MRNATVVGGGVIGLCTAWFLRRAGLDVTVLDAQTIGGGASHGNAGWIVPSLSGPLPAPGVVSLTMRSMFRPDSPVYLKPRLDPALASWLFTFWRRSNARDYASGLEATARLADGTMDLYDELRADGVEFEMRSDGLLFAFLDEDHAVETLDGLRPMEPHGYRLPDKVTPGGELCALEPALGDGVAAGFLVREERHVEPQSLLDGLAARLRTMGVDVRERVPVQVTGDVQADVVVLAAGAWTTALAREFGTPFPMQAGKGYSFSIAADPMPRRPLYLAEAKVGCTPMHGRLRVAGTMELSGVNSRLDERRINAIEAGARRFLRSWSTIEDRWTGMRPVTPDGLPVIGRLRDNVYVATGHSMLGVTLAPATGRALTEFITTGREPAVLQPFRPDRFRRRPS